jgi:hypothetical protein
MLFSRSIISMAALLAAVLCGCATKELPSGAPRPRNGIAEYQQLAAKATQLVAATVEAVGRVGEQTNGVAPRVARAFFKAVERLEVESLQVRERAQAIQTRGDAYFEQWEANLAGVKDPGIRQRARERHDELAQSFARIKSGSQQTRQSFQPFMADLRKLRTALEQDPTLTATASTRDLVPMIAERGRQVERGLAGIRDELTKMKELVALARPGPAH